MCNMVYKPIGTDWIDSYWPDDYGNHVSQPEECLQAGDVIEYRHEVFVCGDPRGFRREKIIVVTLQEEQWVVKCDNGDLLTKTQQVKRVMKMDSGTLEPNVGRWQAIEDYNCIESIESSYESTGVTSAQKECQRKMSALRESIVRHARLSGMPEDLVQIQKDSDDSTKINALQVVQSGSKRRVDMEAKAKEGQKKQAKYVNKKRSGDSTVLPKWSIATLEMPSDRGKFTPPNLPVMICGQKYYSKTNNYRYM